MRKNIFNQKLSKFWNKMDSKILNSKINKSIEILKNPDTTELKKELSKIDTNELLKKIDEFDKSKFDELNIDKKELLEKLSTVDLDKVSNLLGENGNEIITKLKKFLT
ncbi:MAG: membrane trafficking protein [Clostridiales bacterium]|nr:membrane trafficking protein [Clostridiales bacterium]